MEFEVIEALNHLGYAEADENFLSSILKDGPKSVKYTQLVEWLSKELKYLCTLDDHINAITTPDDSSSFLLEVSGFLKEIGCVNKSLTEGHINERLSSRNSRLLLLDFLISEVQAARMIKANNPDESKTMQIQLQESSTAADLKSVLITLALGKPPDGITPEQLFKTVHKKLKDVIAKVPPELLGKPLFNGVLSEKQWHQLSKMHAELQAEYTIRRETLLKRLDVTILSFEWSDKMKGKADEINKTFAQRRQALKAEPTVEIADVLAARHDLAIIEKTSSAGVRRNTQSSINKVVIGRVPDRGGRPNEQQPPPPEMPSWQQRSSAPSSGFSSSSRGGRGGSVGGQSDFSGGRVQAGWNAGSAQKTNDNYQNNRSNQQGSYQDSKGGYQSNKGYQDKNTYQDSRGGYQDNRGGYHENKSGYQDNRGGYQDNRGVYQDNRGGYQDNRGGYQDNRGGYQDNRGGYQDSRGGYQDNRTGFQDGRGGYQNNRGGYQDNRGSHPDMQHNYQNPSNRGGYQNNRGGYQDNRGYQNSRGGFQDGRGAYQNYVAAPFVDTRGFQDNRNSVQDARNYQDSNKSGYSDNRGYQDGRNGYGSRGGYQDRGRGRGRGRGSY